jgi:hypothetical protein
VSLSIRRRLDELHQSGAHRRWAGMPRAAGRCQCDYWRGKDQDIGEVEEMHDDLKEYVAGHLAQRNGGQSQIVHQSGGSRCPAPRTPRRGGGPDWPLSSPHTRAGRRPTVHPAPTDWCRWPPEQTCIAFTVHAPRPRTVAPLLGPRLSPTSVRHSLGAELPVSGINLRLQ